MGNDRKQKDRIQELTEGKACLKSQVFKWLLKTPSEGGQADLCWKASPIWSVTAPLTNLLVLLPRLVNSGSSPRDEW